MTEIEQGQALDLFLELAAIPSPSGSERPVADRLQEVLRKLGLGADEDAAGNLLCRIEPSNGGGGIPLFLCAHLDTVPPEGPIEPVIENGWVRNAAGTILGADNKAAVAVIV